MSRKNFYITYMADETLPLEKCHTGIKALSTIKRNRFFNITEKGKKEGMQFFKECKYPVTKRKSLLFLETKEKGIKIMNRERRETEWNEIISTPITLEVNNPKVISLEEVAEQL